MMQQKDTDWQKETTNQPWGFQEIDIGDVKINNSYPLVN